MAPGNHVLGRDDLETCYNHILMIMHFSKPAKVLPFMVLVLSLLFERNHSLEQTFGQCIRNEAVQAPYYQSRTSCPTSLYQEGQSRHRQSRAYSDGYIGSSKAQD